MNRITGSSLCIPHNSNNQQHQSHNHANTHRYSPYPILLHPQLPHPLLLSLLSLLHLPRHLLQQRHLYSSQHTAPFTLHSNPRVLEAPTPTHHLLQSRQVCSSFRCECHSLFILNSHFSLFTPLNAPIPILTSLSLGQSVRHTTHSRLPSITL